MTAIWTEASVEEQRYSPLKEDREVDVAVIGAGITGLTLAMQLADTGNSVIVLEADRVGRSNTGKSTGNLYSTLSEGLSAVRQKWGDEVSRDVVQSRSEAVDLIEQTVKRFGIDCQFVRRPLFRIQADDQSQTARSLDEEREALRAAGLEPKDIPAHIPGFEAHQGLMLENQAQFNPLQYVQGLAQALTKLGVTIHEHSPVRSVDYGDHLLKTDVAEIRARSIVHATHTPKGIDLLQTGMLPLREYGVSARIKGPVPPEGIFWVLDEFHSLRHYHYQGQDYLMVIGEKHKVGEDDLGQERYQKLRQYLSERFDVEGFGPEWSAQQFSSADKLPYIGRMHGRKNAYVATGFAADGLVWGTVAATVIADLIQERPNQWSQRFDAKRFTPAKSFKGWAEENFTVSKNLLKDYLTPGHLKALDQVQPGQGRVITLEGEKLAVYRDQAGEYSVVSAICPHLKCVVHFNGADTTWDCPCHGSRFRTDGSVIEGPAYGPLGKRIPTSSVS